MYWAGDRQASWCVTLPVGWENTKWKPSLTEVCVRRYTVVALSLCTLCLQLPPQRTVYWTELNAYSADLVNQRHCFQAFCVISLFKRIAAICCFCTEPLFQKIILPATAAQHYSYSQRRATSQPVVIFVNGSAHSEWLLSVCSATLPTQVGHVAPADGLRDWRRRGRLLTIPAEFLSPSAPSSLPLARAQCC